MMLIQKQNHLTKKSSRRKKRAADFVVGCNDEYGPVGRLQPRHGVLNRETDLRPFVCEGSPIECESFLVGINPASEMSVDFWDF